MDSVAIAVILAVIAGLIAVGLLGYKQQKKAAATTAKVNQDILRQNPGAELLGPISYHGGFPPMAKPSVLQLGLTEDSLIIYDYKGWSGKVPCRDWRGIERFTVLAKADTTGKSTVILGPLVPYFYKDKLRYFIAIKYIDINNQENHLLIEPSSETIQKDIYARLSREKVRVAHGCEGNKVG
jgi:uncharacterized protein YqkB